MPCKELVVCRPAWKSMTLCVCVLLFNVFSVNASYNFTIRFYEFRNPLGLQCDECGSDGGLPACCDDVQRRENCINVAPFTCDTRFRFLLRPFGSPVETAPNTGFPHFTLSNAGNSATFNEGSGGLLALPNPFTINSTTPWPGRIQFFIDAVDRPVAMSTSNISETLAIINRFPIDLELDPGPNFTERTTYTGIYNISGLGFDMSFRVQCAENFYGPSCNMSCIPLEGVYTCGSEGSVICLNDNRDPSTNCSTCLQGWDLTTNCSTCSLYYDEQSQCTQCVTGMDISTNCTTCLPGASCQSSQEPSPGDDLPVVVGAVVVALLVAILLIITLVVVIIVFKRKRETKVTFSAREGSNASTSPSSQDQPPAGEGGKREHFKERNFENPIYGEGSTPAGSDTLKGEIILPASGTHSGHKGTNGSQDDNKLEVINPGYHKFREASHKPSEAEMSVTTQPLDSMYASVGQETSRKVIPGEADGAAVLQHNEYDAIVRHELSTSAPPGSAAGIVPPVYTEVGGESPREGEVYNVAYPVLTRTPKEGETEVVDGYACLSSVH